MLVVVASKFSVSSHFRRTNTHSRYGHKRAQSFHQGEIELKCKKDNLKEKRRQTNRKQRLGQLMQYITIEPDSTFYLYINKLYINKLYINKLYFNKLYINKLYINKIYIKKLYIKELYINKLCINKLYTNKLYINKLYINNIYINKRYTKPST